MTVGDIHSFFELWAPRDIAWEKDNPGLQVGDAAADVRGILLALDATERVIAEAVRRRANLLVTHHPLLYRPLREVTERGAQGRIVRSLIRSGINLYSAHTNLDFTRGGTSEVLGSRLGLVDMEFLSLPYRPSVKVVTFSPSTAVEQLATAMAEAGAGRIGNYSSCSFRTPGTGTFLGNAVTRPAIGRRGRLEHVDEVRLEMVAPKRDLDRVLIALRGAHPYEEPAFDVIPLENTSTAYGMGIIGTLPRPVALRAFLPQLKKKLHCGALRWTGTPSATVRRVALCGGGGADLLDEAVRKKADVFVTADISYHRFHDAGGRIALVDAGHYETEFPVLDAVAVRLRQFVRGARSGIPVAVARTSTNPVAYLS
jgi:dinuclear metal center YbgI/SA1388 family protein